MKKIVLIFSFIVIWCIPSYGQKSLPVVDYKGHIIREKTQIGTISHTGSKDMADKPVTKINSGGQIVDSNGKLLGKAAKGSSFVYYLEDKPENFTIGKYSHSGMCEVKNSKGQTVMLLHKNYKQEAACAIHCLYENKCMPMK
jgi:nitrous oxide reductase